MEIELAEGVDEQAGVRQHVVAALLASLRRVAALEALVIDANPGLLAAERARILEMHRVPVEVSR